MHSNITANQWEMIERGGLLAGLLLFHTSPVWARQFIVFRNCEIRVSKIFWSNSSQENGETTGQ